MANYIQSLQAESLEKSARINAAYEEIMSFQALLLSPKHQGTASDGTRNDWISTADVLRRLEMIRQALTD